MSRQIKILAVVESIDVEDSSGSKANVALLENLKKEGFELKVYHYTRKDIHLSGVECVSIKEKRWNHLYLLSRMQRHIQNDLKIIINKPLENLFGFSFTFFNDSRSIAQSIKKSNFKPDIVLTLSKGASFRPHHALLQLPGLHNKWLAYIHDPYPFSYYPDPYRWIEPGNEQKIEFFKELAQKCRWAGFPSLFLQEWMIKFFPAFAHKSVIIPHQINAGSTTNISLPSYFAPNKFSLLHAGNLIKQRSPISLIEGYKKFLIRYPEAQQNSQLLLLGNADYYLEELKKLEERIPQLYVSDGNVSYDVVLELQKRASANIILESTAKISPFLPGKFPHCISANRTILLLAPNKSETVRLLGTDYEFFTEADSTGEITNLIGRLYEIWTANSESLKLNRPDLIEYLSSTHLKTTINNLE